MKRAYLLFAIFVVVAACLAVNYAFNSERRATQQRLYAELKLKNLTTAFGAEDALLREDYDKALSEIITLGSREGTTTAVAHLLNLFWKEAGAAAGPVTPTKTFCDADLDDIGTQTLTMVLYNDRATSRVLSAIKLKAISDVVFCSEEAAIYAKALLAAQLFRQGEAEGVEWLREISNMPESVPVNVQAFWHVANERYSKLPGLRQQRLASVSPPLSFEDQELLMMEILMYEKAEMPDKAAILAERYLKAGYISHPNDIATLRKMADGAADSGTQR